MSRPDEFSESVGRRIVKARDEGVCVRCRRGTVVHWDHRKNRSVGGSWAPSNGQLVCPDDHDWKTNHPREAITAGLGCPGWARPEAWPARRWRPTAYGTVKPAWALLDDEGGITWISDEEAQLRMTGDYPGVSIYDDRRAG